MPLERSRLWERSVEEGYCWFIGRKSRSGESVEEGESSSRHSEEKQKSAADSQVQQVL